MQSLKQLAGQTAVYGLSSIVGRFMNYLLTPLYTYQFIAREYGVVTEMYAYVAFLVVLLTFGMETAFFRFSNKSESSHDVYNTALIPVLTGSLFFVALGILFCNTLSEIIEYPDHPEYIIWFAAIVGLDAISSIPLARLRQENKAFKFARINLTSIGINIGLNVFFIGYCKVRFDLGETNFIIDTLYNPEIGVGYIFISNLASSILKTLLLLPYLALIRPKVNYKLLRSMLIYALPLLIAGIAGIANENIDRILLKFLLIDEFGREYTMTQVGIYGACYKISILITLFIQAYRYAAEPFFFSKASDIDAKKTYADLMTYFVLICLIIFFFLVANLSWVMKFVGEEYRVGAGIVPILLIANIFLGIYYNLSVWYKLTDKTIVGAYISVGGAAVTIFFNLMLIPIIGYVGSAWATLICYFLMALFSYKIGQKYYPVPYPLAKLAIYFLVTIALYFVISNLSINATYEVIINNIVFAGLLVLFYTLERPKKIII